MYETTLQKGATAYGKAKAVQIGLLVKVTRAAAEAWVGFLGCRGCEIVQSGFWTDSPREGACAYADAAASLKCLIELPDYAKKTRPEPSQTAARSGMALQTASCSPFGRNSFP